METVLAGLTVHEQITERMIEILEEGIIPWKTSWGQSEQPMNLMTLRPYRGINALLLAAYEYEQNYFLTDRQIEKMGAAVRKGQKPHMVIDGVGFRSLCPYEVYNVCQCVDIPKKLIPAPNMRSTPEDAAKEVITQMWHCPRVRHGHSEPLYFYKTDTIYMPTGKAYETRQDYLMAFLKPLIASCMHESRLGWIEISDCTAFDPEAKLQAELVPEVGAFMLRSFMGLHEKKESDQETIEEWICGFKRYPNLAFEAALKAQEAFEFITGLPFDARKAMDFVEDYELPF